MRKRTGAAFLLLSAAAAQGAWRVAAFRADVTPRTGEPLIWTAPVSAIDDPLLAKGIVLEDEGGRYVLCAIDWCGLGNRAHRLFRDRLAQAAGTEPSRVAVHTIHQHTAPYVDASGYDILEAQGLRLLRFTDSALEQRAAAIAEAVRKAVASLEPFDMVGTGEAPVERVASARRLRGPNGKIVVRYSTSGKDPAMAEAPEGNIDPLVRTISFARGQRVLARLRFYATHPQTWCCDGHVSADFVGAARERLEREEKVPEIYFTGCAGDVTVGKYNDASPARRAALAERLLEGLKQSAATTKWQVMHGMEWRTAPVELPKRFASDADIEARLASLKQPNLTVDEQYRRAIQVAFAQRKEPFELAALKIGRVRMLFLPGEPMLAFQEFARQLRPDVLVAVAGYGDVAPGYICTDRAYAEGGYEPSASNTKPGAEGAMKNAIRTLLEDK